MRISILFILAIGTLNNVFGQPDPVKTSDLDSMYLKTLKSQFDLMLSSGHKYFRVDKNTERIKDKVNVDIFKFISENDLINKSIKEKKTISVYFVVHKIISIDTVDINISDASLTAKKTLWKRKANFAVSCGGTNGYVPTARFAYNSLTMTWDRIDFIKPRTFRDRPKDND
jgi:hypothetical protein